MERLKSRYVDVLKSLNTLDEILKGSFSIIVRDAAIQRFQYTFEALWKFLKQYLQEKEGKICNSPKSVFREIFSIGFLTEEETVKCLKMTDDRNDTVHTYKEEVAKAIYGRISDYFALMKPLAEKFKTKI
ncbi:MAG: nucleotidyltransferase substrate binding protein [Elusimicrobia bacterium]|nr:nucleotidyltransferase substrate binding protein [Elusimicrobiota bacterium]